jgi:hypothetical protein
MSDLSSFEGRRECQEALVCLLLWAREHEARSIAAFDPDFSDWPWSRHEVLDALKGWARRGRRLRLLALDFALLQQSQPRFVRWRCDFGHVVEARAASADEPAPELPAALLLVDAGEAGVRGLRLFEKLRWRGEVFADQGQFSLHRYSFDAASQRSTEAFPCTTLGL